jgi:hypothetical protein
VGDRLRLVSGASVVVLAFFLTAGCEEDASDAPGVSGAGGGGGPGGDCSSNPADSACTACLKMGCCDKWKTCRGDTPCAACADCLGREQDLENCGAAQGVCEIKSTTDPTAEVLSCGLSACEMECGFS